MSKYKGINWNNGLNLLRHEVATYFSPKATPWVWEYTQICALKGQLKIYLIMVQSLSKLYVHIIFHVKFDHIKVRNEVMNELYAYMGAIIKDNDSVPIIINGTDNHVHILCVMSKNICMAKLVEEIKRHSSRWIKDKGLHYRKFAWQGGYSSFSVSQSLHDKTKRYIENQEEHHRQMTFKEEYMMFLKEYRLDYNEKYLWTD